LLVPGERQTQVRQQLQIARLAPVEDRLDDVRGEIIEAPATSARSPPPPAMRITEGRNHAGGRY